VGLGNAEIILPKKNNTLLFRQHELHGPWGQQKKAAHDNSLDFQPPNDNFLLMENINIGASRQWWCFN